MLSWAILTIHIISFFKKATEWKISETRIYFLTNFKSHRSHAKSCYQFSPYKNRHKMCPDTFQYLPSGKSCLRSMCLHLNIAWDKSLNRRSLFLSMKPSTLYVTCKTMTWVIWTSLLVGCSLTSHSAIFQLYSDRTVVKFPNFDMLPGTMGS